MVKLRIALVAAAVTLIASAAVLVALLAGGKESFGYEDPFDRFPPAQTNGSGREVGWAPSAAGDLSGFLGFVFTDIQAFWATEFRRWEQPYDPAQLVVFEDRVRTACGPASERIGPFYCLLDESVYLDLDCFRELAVEFEAPGDFAQAYVIAHEVGHHVQNETGITAQVNAAIAKGIAPPNELSIRVELQADCLAGVWGHSTSERGIIENGDLDEGLRAAAAVGDDRIQKHATGRIDPETWTHGSSAQRRFWFLRGFEEGDPAACDTFSADV